MFHDNLTQKFISRLKCWPKNLIKSYKIDPKIYFSAKKVPSKNGTSRIPIYGSYPPPRDLSKPKFLKILIFVELVFCNNFKCELNELHKMDPSKLGFWRSWFCINSLIIMKANVDFIKKNIKNYHDHKIHISKPW